MNLGKTNDEKIDLYFYTKSQKDGNRDFQILTMVNNENALIDYGNATIENFDSFIDFGHAAPLSLSNDLSNFKITIYNNLDELLGTYYTNKYGSAKINSPFEIWKWKVEKLGYEGFTLTRELNPNKIYKLIKLNYSLT